MECSHHKPRADPSQRLTVYPVHLAVSAYCSGGRIYWCHHTCVCAERNSKKISDRRAVDMISNIKHLFAIFWSLLPLMQYLLLLFVIRSY